MDTDRFNKIALIAAVALAVTGYYLLEQYRVQFEAEASGGRKVQVLMVTRNLQSGTRITRDMLGVRAIPRAFIDERHIQASRLQAVIGVRTSSNLKATESLLWSDLDGSDRRAKSLANMIGVGKRAVTIPATGESIFGGLLQPGDRVDALLTGNGERGDTGTIPLAQNLLVLAVGAKTDAEAAQEGQRGGRAGGGGTVTLAATLEQTQELTLARQFGTISLVLRNPDDVRVVQSVPRVNAATLLGAQRRRRREVAGDGRVEALERALRIALEKPADEKETATAPAPVPQPSVTSPQRTGGVAP
jgi:pilus assembly protein CpaB